MASPDLHVYQSLWAMEDLPAGATASWSLPEQLEQLQAAGFAGFAVDLGARQAPKASAVASANRSTGLRSAVFTFAGSDQELDTALRFADSIGSHEVVLCARYFTPDVGQAVTTVQRWAAHAERAGVHLQLETHRNTLTNDLRFASLLADALDPAFELAIDLSHYIVGAEVPEAPSDEIESHVRRILARAGSVQGRIATRCQVQIPLTYPGAGPWVALAQRWWRLAFEAILLRRGGSADPVMFVTELGTTPYAILGSDGRELSDRWAEACVIRDWAEEIYASASAALHDVRGVHGG